MTPPIINATAVPVEAKVPPLDVHQVWRFDRDSAKWFCLLRGDHTDPNWYEEIAGDLQVHITSAPQPDASKRIAAMREALAAISRNSVDSIAVATANHALAADDTFANAEKARGG